MSDLSTKDAIIEMIRRLPDDVTVADIMAELYFRQKVDKGLRELDAGEGIDHDEVKKRLGPWLRARAEITCAINFDTQHDLRKQWHTFSVDSLTV